MEKADVSVVIPVFNSLNTIDRALDSVLKQTMLPAEIVIIDDCSTDPKFKAYLNLIKEEKKDEIDIKVYFLSKNSGPATARNVGIKNSIGTYIAFLDSDDAWHPRKIEIQYTYMKSNRDVYFSCHHGVIINSMDELSPIKDKDLVVSNINPYKYLFKHCMNGSGTPAVMIKRVQGMFFYENKRYFEDYLLWLEYTFTYKSVVINEFLSASFKELYGAGGLSADLWKMEKGELETFRILKEKGYINYYIYIFVSLWSMFKYMCREVICSFR